ncbi:MAG: DNA alkylation repair protein [Pseudomonadota bacterium]
MNPLEHAVAALAPLADPARAPHMRAYMKEHFAFLGIQTPARRAAIAPLLRAMKGSDRAALLAAAQALWRQPEREYQYVALDLLARYWKTLSLADLDALLALACDKSWWDSVDGMAGIIGDILHAALAHTSDCQRRMDQALASDNLWVRRIAMLHQLGWRADTDRQRLFSYALALAAEPDFFIRKAIGWALRDHARHAPDQVRQFLLAQAGVLSPLTLREAGKHLALPVSLA